MAKPHPTTQRASSKPPEDRVLARNKKARHDYHTLDTFDAGLALTGTEVKSARAGRVQLKDSYVDFRGTEAFLIGVHISPYDHGNRENHPAERPRKLLLRRRELDKLFGRLQTKGLTAVPLSLSLRGRWIKAEIALVQGKRQYDKREAERRRELDREAREAMKAVRAPADAR